MKNFLSTDNLNKQRFSAAGQWIVTGCSACLEVSDSEPLPSGWILLKGEVERHDLKFSTSLVAVVEDLENQTVTLPVAVSRKGTIFELLHLPKETVGLTLEPTRFDEFSFRAISLTRVGKIERIARMYRRVIPMLFKQPRVRRHRAGLRSFTPLVDLSKAYRIACRLRDYNPELSYEKWIEEVDTLTKNDRRLILRQIKQWRNPPRFHVFLYADSNQTDPLLKTIESLRRQLYQEFKVSLLIPCGSGLDLELPEVPAWVEIFKSRSIEDLIEFANVRLQKIDQPAWTLLMRGGELLAEHALYWLASEASSHSEAGLLYSDHDVLDRSGRRTTPVFKPDWSSELLRSTNYLGCAITFRVDLLLAAGGLRWSDIHNAENHDLSLRISEQVPKGGIRHIPAILWHCPDIKLHEPEETLSAKAVPVARHLRRLKIAAEIEHLPGEHYRIRYQLPENPPLISIIVPTRDAVSHVKACVNSVLDKSTYRNFELLVIDNQSSHAGALAYLAEIAKHPQVRLLHYNHPFNYSDINNFASRHARGTILCFLNNDTEVISPDWIEEMLGHLLQSAVGAVGAKLYYSDGRVQHAGDTVGPGGCAHHLHAMIERDDPGYCNRAILAQDLSAVTAACMMTWKFLYQQLGGLNMKNLPIAFNDVDYCLRVRESGYRIVWSPYAELYHHESISRGKENNFEQEKQMKLEIAYMRRRWKHVMLHDPFYNPNLSYDRPDFSLNVAPMIKKPWQSRI